MDEQTIAMIAEMLTDDPDVLLEYDPKHRFKHIYPDLDDEVLVGDDGDLTLPTDWQDPFKDTLDDIERRQKEARGTSLEPEEPQQHAGGTWDFANYRDHHAGSVGVETGPQDTSMSFDRLPVQLGEPMISRPISNTAEYRQAGDHMLTSQVEVVAPLLGDPEAVASFIQYATPSMEQHEATDPMVRWQFTEDFQQGSYLLRMLLWVHPKDPRYVIGTDQQLHDLQEYVNEALAEFTTNLLGPFSRNENSYDDTMDEDDPSDDWKRGHDIDLGGAW